MRNLSKSKLIAYRQCPKRLWLEIHAPELREDSATAQMNFMIGYAVGDIAQQLYDPNENRQIIDAQTEGYPQAFARTQALLTANRPIFEAGFCAEGGMAFACPAGSDHWYPSLGAFGLLLSNYQNMSNLRCREKALNP